MEPFINSPKTPTRPAVLDLNYSHALGTWGFFPRENTPRSAISIQSHVNDDNDTNWVLPRIITPVNTQCDIEGHLPSLGPHITPFRGFSYGNGAKTRSGSSCGYTNNSPTASRWQVPLTAISRGTIPPLSAVSNDPLQLDSSMVKCHIKQMDSHIMNANDLLNELESSLAADTQLSTIFNSNKQQQQVSEEPSLIDQENLLNEWVKNRRNLYMKLHPELQQQKQQVVRRVVVKAKSKSRSNKVKTNSPSSKLKLKIQRSLPKKLTLTKPSYIKEFYTQLKERKLPTKPIQPIDISITTLSHSETQSQYQSQPPSNTPAQKYDQEEIKPKKKQQTTHKLLEPFITTPFKPHQLKLLKNGEFTNAQDQIFPCSQCPKSFTQKSQWRRHVECVHLNLVRYHCEFCRKGFKRSDHLKNHSRRLHGQQ